MKLIWIAAVWAISTTGSSYGQEAVCPNSVSTNEYSSCVTEVTNPETGNVDSLKVKIKNKSAFPLKCDLVVDSFQAKLSALGIDDCMSDTPGTSRIRQRDQVPIPVKKATEYSEELVTGQAALDEAYSYCRSSINANVSCTRGCEDGYVEVNGECVPGDCYDPTYGVVLKEGATLDKVANSTLPENRCNMTTLRFSCNNRISTSVQIAAEVGVMVGGQCTSGCFDRNNVYRAPNVTFRESYSSFFPDQTCSYTDQSSICRNGYSAPAGDQNVTPGFTHGAECRTACEVDGRRLALGEVIEGTWSAPRLPTCESVRFDKVCGDRYVLSTKRNSRIIRPSGQVGRPGEPRPSRCGGGDLF
jgi:hypothetical protein